MCFAPSTPISLLLRLREGRKGGQYARVRISGCVYARLTASASTPNAAWASVRAGGRHVLELRELVVSLEPLANVLCALGADVVAPKAARDAGVVAAVSKCARRELRVLRVWRGRAGVGGQRALELREPVVVLEHLANVLCALGADFVA